MLTALRGMSYVLISAVLCFAPISAAACSLVLQMSATMSPNSADLTNADRLRLVELIINVRNLPLPSQAIVYGYALPDERNPVALATRRTQSVVKFLAEMGVPTTDVVHVESTVVPASSKREATALADVQFSPICPAGGCGYLCNTPIER